MSTLWSGTQTTPTFAYSSSTYSCPTSSVTTISATDYQFCDVIFRNIESPSRLAEWRALPAYAGDVWFASQAPSGSAKVTAMSLIEDLTGCAKGAGHTEFGGACVPFSRPCGVSPPGLDEKSPGRSISVHPAPPWQTTRPASPRRSRPPPLPAAAASPEPMSPSSSCPRTSSPRPRGSSPLACGPPCLMRVLGKAA